MSEDIELMSLEDIDWLRSEHALPLSTSDSIVIRLCNTARAAHKLKERVEELEAQLSVVGGSKIRSRIDAGKRAAND